MTWSFAHFYSQVLHIQTVPTRIKPITPPNLFFIHYLIHSSHSPGGVEVHVAGDAQWYRPEIAL